MKISSGFFSYFVCLFLVVNLSQASENALKLKYAHGNTSDKTYDKKESSFCVLNIHAKSLSYEDYIEKIISINADVVCLPGIIWAPRTAPSGNLCKGKVFYEYLSVQNKD